MTFCIQTADVSRLLQWTMELSEHIEKFEEVHRASFVSALICSCTGQSGMVRFIFHQFWHTVMMAAWQFSSTSVTSTQLWSCLILWTTMSPKCCRLQTLPCAVFVPFSTLSIAYEYIKGGTVGVGRRSASNQTLRLARSHWNEGLGRVTILPLLRFLMMASCGLPKPVLGLLWTWIPSAEPEQSPVSVT